jgi:cytochrome P450
MKPDDVDLFDPGVQADPYEAYRVLREQAPVWRMPRTGWYVVTRYAELQEVVRKPDVYSMRVGEVLRSPYQDDREVHRIFKHQGWVNPGSLSTDPPRHAKYRSIVDLGFTAKRVRGLQADIEKLIHALIDTWIEEGEVDFIESFCTPLPMRVICDRLGLPAEDLPQLKAWSEAWVLPFAMNLDSDKRQWVARMNVELQHYFVQKFEEKRKHPEDDILSDLVHARFDGERALETAELLSIAEQVLVGGNETTTNALASGMKLLIDNPDQERLLRNDPSLLGTFVEEVLRLESPTQGLFRVSLEPSVLGGIEIPTRSLVHLRFAAANRDPDHFENPDRLDVRRANARTQVAFSQGPHVCLGAPLARQELLLAFRILLTRLAEIRIAEGQEEFRYVPGFTLRALEKLRIAFRPST